MKPGWLDWPAPLFDLIDRALASAMPDVLRVILYGLGVSYLGMVMYARLSNQPRLRAVKRLTRRVRSHLHDPDIEFSALLAASRRSLALSLRHLGLVLLPSLVTLLPLLFVLPWLSNRFGSELPEPGTTLTWCVLPVERAAEVRIGDAMPDAQGCARAPWPEQPTPITWRGDTIATAPWAGASGVLHARRGWNRLIGNPAGELPDNVGDLEIHVDLPAPSLLPVGPAWLGQWLVWFLAPGLVAGFYWRWRWQLV